MGSTSSMALPKPLSTLRPLLGAETLPRSSRDSSECTDDESSFRSAPPRSALCTELSIRMGAMCEAVIIWGGSGWWPDGLEPASFCTGRTWAVGLAELEVKWFSSVTGLSLSAPSEWTSSPGDGKSVRQPPGRAGPGRAGTRGALRLSFSSALSELSSRACTPIGLGEELEHSEELPSRAVW